MDRQKDRCQGGGGDPKNDCGNKENAEDQGSGHVYIVFLLQDFFYHFVAKYWLNTADLVHHAKLPSCWPFQLTEYQMVLEEGQI